MLARLQYINKLVIDEDKFVGRKAQINFFFFQNKPKFFNKKFVFSQRF